MKRISIIDVLLSLLVIVLVATTLAPAIARAHRSAAEAKCQSNLQRWAEAMELYRADNHNRFPVNLLNNSYKTTCAAIPLASPDPIPPATEPQRNTWGATWVEALYSYLKVSANKTGQDWKSFRSCPNARDYLYPPAPSNGMNLNWAMSYVFNGTLAGQPIVIVKDAKKLMMIREFGRLTVSTLRPANVNPAASPIGNPENKPRDPFLCNEDDSINSTQNNTAAECQLHGNGSYILFADGHIGHFDISYYPQTSEITAATNWDPITQQWWNHIDRAPDTSVETAQHKAIAITP